MTRCISREQLAELVPSLDHPALAHLEHLASCAECRGEVEALDHVREALRPDEELSAGFVDQVMTRIEEEAATERVSAAVAGRRASARHDGAIAPRKPTAGVRSALSTLLVALLSGVAVTVVLVAVPATEPVGPEPSARFSLLMGLLTASALMWWELARGRFKYPASP